MDGCLCTVQKEKRWGPETVVRGGRTGGGKGGGKGGDADSTSRRVFTWKEKKSGKSKAD